MQPIQAGPSTTKPKVYAPSRRKAYTPLRDLYVERVPQVLHRYMRYWAMH